MTTRKLSAGDIIEARCTKCREVLNHRIVAMVEGKVVRVECNTCNGVHNYYPPPSAKEAKAPRKAAVSKTRSTTAVPRAIRKDPAESEREEWASLSLTFDHEKALPYDMKGRFQVKSLILHPVFGLGVVKAVIVPNKMQILFKDGIKLLRCQCA
jgi:hypothetical protein